MLERYVFQESDRSQRAIRARKLLRTLHINCFASDICFALLRGATDINNGSFNDIDLFLFDVSPEASQAFFEILKKTATDCQLNIISSQTFFKMKSYLLVDQKYYGISIRLDVFTSLRKGPFVYYPTRLLSEGITFNNEISCYEIVSEVQLALKGLRSQLGMIRRRISLNSFCYLIRQFLLGHFSLLESLYYLYELLVSRLRDVISEPRSVAIMGIDGSGKTTLSVMLKQKLERSGLYSSVQYSHYHHFVLPPVRSLVSLKSPKRSSQFQEDRHRTSIVSISRYKSAFLTLYYSFDYLLHRIRLILFGNGDSVIIYDRYFFQYFSYPYRSAWVARACMSLGIVRVPDLTILLHCSPIIAFERKQELSPEVGDYVQTNLFKSIEDYCAADKILLVYSIDQEAEDLADRVASMVVDRLGDIDQ